MNNITTESLINKNTVNIQVSAPCISTLSQYILRLLVLEQGGWEHCISSAPPVFREGRYNLVVLVSFSML